MNWQTVLVVLLVAGAAVYVARRMWRTWMSAKDGCAGSCGCSSAAKQAAGTGAPAVFLPAEQLTLRRRESNPL